MGNGFASWMHQVDTLLDAAVGLVSSDLEDVNYRDWYEDGVKPASAAKRAIRNAGFAL